MSSVITGDASTVSNSLQRNVNGATNASPIVISTTADHLFATGDQVVIESVGGNTAANGTWTIIKVTSTTFSLTGSTGSGAYTSGGTATDVSLTPQFTIPDDGDDLDAASVNVAFEALADRTQYLAQMLVAQIHSPITYVSGTTEWICPPGVFWVEIEACGGGGGGGGGADGGTSTSDFAVGGGGGGGSLRVVRRISVTPDTVYEMVIGAGGTAGVGNTSNGGDGGDTIFQEQTGPVVLATWKGAKGGKKGLLHGLALGVLVPGGSSVAMYRPTRMNIALPLVIDPSSCFGPGFGGDGADMNFFGFDGADSAEGFAGGAGGVAGAIVSSYKGGGAGGGGAAGPYSDGVAGLDGGAGHATNGVNAETPGIVSGNGGWGGGGGGGGGGGSSAGGLGSDGIGGGEGYGILRVVA